MRENGAIMMMPSGCEREEGNGGGGGPFQVSRFFLRGGSFRFVFQAILKAQAMRTFSRKKKK